MFYYYYYYYHYYYYYFVKNELAAFLCIKLQRPPPALQSHELESCHFLQTFLNNEVNSLVNLTVEKGVHFLYV